MTKKSFTIRYHVLVTVEAENSDKAYKEADKTFRENWNKDGGIVPFVFVTKIISVEDI